MVVEGAEGEPVRVFDMAGRMVASGTGTVNVPTKGVYLVRVGDRRVQKVAVTK